MTPTQRPASTSDARKRLAEKAGTVHHAPIIGSGGITPCCGRTPFELPRTDRLTVEDALVTCGGMPTPAEPDAASREAAIRAVHRLEAQHADPSVEQYVDAVLAAGYSRTPDAHLAAAKAEALEEAADDWTEWEVYEDADGARSIRRRDVPLPSWLRARAARLREQGGE